MIKLRFSLLALLALIGIQSASAQIFEQRLPIYIVNGERMSEEEVKAIHPADIVSNELLTVDESVIEKYGHDAANGVVIITLRYDTPARFEVDGTEVGYSNYIAERVKWNEIDGVARVVMSFTVSSDGTVKEKEVLEASDRRLLNRIRKAMAAAPRWVAAKKDGKGIETDHILRITLPFGRQMPRKGVILIR